MENSVITVVLSVADENRGNYQYSCFSTTSRIVWCPLITDLNKNKCYHKIKVNLFITKS